MTYLDAAIARCRLPIRITFEMPRTLSGVDDGGEWSMAYEGGWQVHLIANDGHNTPLAWDATHDRRRAVGQYFRVAKEMTDDPHP